MFRYASLSWNLSGQKAYAYIQEYFPRNQTLVFKLSDRLNGIKIRFTENFPHIYDDKKQFIFFPCEHINYTYRYQSLFSPCGNVLLFKFSIFLKSFLTQQLPAIHTVKWLITTEIKICFVVKIWRLYIVLLLRLKSKWFR